GETRHGDRDREIGQPRAEHPETLEGRRAGVDDLDRDLEVAAIEEQEHPGVPSHLQSMAGAGPPVRGPPGSRHLEAVAQQPQIAIAPQREVERLRPRQTSAPEGEQQHDRQPRARHRPLGHNLLPPRKCHNNISRLGSGVNWQSSPNSSPQETSHRDGRLSALIGALSRCWARIRASSANFGLSGGLRRRWRPLNGFSAPDTAKLSRKRGRACWRRRKPAVSVATALAAKKSSLRRSTAPAGDTGLLLAIISSVERYKGENSLGSARPSWGSSRPSWGRAFPRWGSPLPHLGPALPYFGRAWPFLGAASPSWGARRTSLDGRRPFGAGAFPARTALSSGGSLDPCRGLAW